MFIYDEYIRDYISKYYNMYISKYIFEYFGVSNENYENYENYDMSDKNNDDNRKLMPMDKFTFINRSIDYDIDNSIDNSIDNNINSTIDNIYSDKLHNNNINYVMPIIRRNRLNLPVQHISLYQPNTYLEFICNYMLHRIIPVKPMISLEMPTQLDTIEKLLSGDIDIAFINEELLTRYIKNDCKYLKALKISLDIDNNNKLNNKLNNKQTNKQNNKQNINVGKYVDKGMNMDINFSAIGIGYYSDFYMIVPNTSQLLQPADLILNGNKFRLGILVDSFYYFIKLAPLYGINLTSLKQKYNLSTTKISKLVLDVGIGLSDETGLLSIKLYNNLVGTSVDNPGLFDDFKNNNIDVIFIVENSKCVSLRDLAKNMNIRVLYMQQHISLPTYPTKQKNQSGTNMVNVANTFNNDEQPFNRYGFNKDEFNIMVRKVFQWIFPRVVDLNKIKVPTANTYSYLETYATRNILVARNNIPPKIIEYLTQNYIDELEKMRVSIDKKLFSLGLANSDGSFSTGGMCGHDFNYDELISFDQVIPIHESAYKIYKKEGLIKTITTTNTNAF